MLMIRVFLIVLSCVLVVEALMDLLKFCYGLKSREVAKECGPYDCLIGISILLKLFLFVWSIVGGIYVFPTFIQLDCANYFSDKSVKCSCNYSVLVSTVCTLTALYWKLLISILLGCCVCCCKKNKHDY